MQTNGTKFNGHDDEQLSAEDRKLSRMLGGLSRVDAPRDFDIKLRARISARTVENSRPAVWLPALRYALPLLLVLMIGGAVLVNLRTSDEAGPAVVSNPAPESAPTAPSAVAETPPVEEVAQVPSRLPAEVPVSAREVRRAAIPSGRSAVPTEISSAAVQPSNTAVSAGSRDAALTEQNKVIHLNPAPNNSAPRGSAAVKDILSTIGIEAELEGNVWKVRSVRKDGVAERSGVHVGDTIEAVDGRAIDQATAGGSIRSVSVRRDGGSIKIDLVNEP
jgi:biotin carboxyl carrier protein